MNKKIVSGLILSVLVLGMFAIPTSRVLANQSSSGDLLAVGAGGGVTLPSPVDPSGGNSGDTEEEITRIANKISQILVTVAIALVVIVLIIGAIMYMTAGGNSEQAEKARTVIINGIIGAVIIIALSFLIGFIFSTGDSIFNNQ